MTVGHLGASFALLLAWHVKLLAALVSYVCSLCYEKTTTCNQSGPSATLLVENAFDRDWMDCVGLLPLTESANRYIAVLCDYLTKRPEAFLVPTIDTTLLAKLFVHEIIGRHGASRILLSDRREKFLSKLLKEICRLVNTDKVNTTN